MLTNPYESPQERPVLGTGKKRRGILFTLLALGFWLLALILIAIAFDVLNRPENITRRAQNFGLFLYAAFVTLVVPISVLVLFGIACWRRSKFFTYAGFGAIALIPLNVLCVYLIGLIRRWFF
jgi:hypothetical protein